MRALIVDDEKTTRQTLRDLVPWAEVGVDAVDTAANGIEALERMSQARADVLLCDVRMPRMDGIELARRVRAEYSDCVIVFLSGYSEAEYLKGAIRVQAADYIDKPIDIGQVTQAMGAAVATARERSAARELEGTAAEAARRAQLQRESLALELLSPRSDAASIAERFGDRASAPFLGGAARAAVLAPRSAAAERGLAERGAELHGLASSINGGGRSDFCLLACRLEAERLAIVAGPSGSGTGGALEKALEAMAEATGAWIGLGPPSSPPLAASLEAAPRALALRYYSPEGRLFVYRDVRRPHFVLEREELSNFRAAVSARDGAAARATIDTLRSKAMAVADEEINRITSAFLELGLAIVEIAPGWNVQEAAAEREALEAGLGAAESLDAAAPLVEGLVERCFGSGAARLGARRKSEKAKDFIRSRYRDPGLSIAQIARAADLSESYLCTLFKRECGTTVLDFITELRIEAAKVMLVEGDAKVQAIAAEVGFRDPEWFSTLFKRVAGMPPAEYRERHRR